MKRNLSRLKKNNYDSVSVKVYSYTDHLFYLYVKIWKSVNVCVQCTCVLLTVVVSTLLTYKPLFWRHSDADFIILHWKDAKDVVYELTFDPTFYPFSKSFSVSLFWVYGICDLMQRDDSNKTFPLFKCIY